MCITIKNNKRKITKTKIETNKRPKREYQNKEKRNKNSLKILSLLCVGQLFGGMQYRACPGE